MPHFALRAWSELPVPQLLGIAVVNTNNYDEQLRRTATLDNYAQHRLSDPHAARDGSIPTCIARQLQETVRDVGTPTVGRYHE